MSAPVIALWAVPRSRSTAFLRMLIERGDLEVVHEPFSNLAAVGHFDVAGRRAGSTGELFDLLLALAEERGRTVFFKETTDYPYDEILADQRLYTSVVNTFMIRDPAAVIASHYAMNPAVERDEIGFERLHGMVTAVRAATGRDPLVLDGDEMAASPAEAAARFCAETGLPPLPQALTWQSGSQDMFSRTQAWHRDVEASTGFTTEATRHGVRPDNDPRLAELDAYHRPFYEALRATRFVPAPA
ncbi:hypothetical protein QEZ54_16355 [Catellatospora sp. KI3]|uniref:sulfotransferase-like domain-containing protein n=1 Tax=Catellatospora sp. KI3 TaxID=3041620 RepID=UPI0024830A66|nr:hypothetical protein [Catellatospora sp. KI3]MDI1462545.1 hypothetical protein [Catellatospora sp. KI3]